MGIPTSTCSDLNTCRTFWNIIYSALATLLACIWVSVHPNVPGRKEGELQVFWRRFQLMCLDLIAPEIVVLWSIRQWLVARRLSKDFELSKTHSFFVSMGGFVVPTPSGNFRTIKPDMVPHFLTGIKAINRREIEDKSKGDALSKFMTLFQISFFVAQCVGRFLQKLQMTELELVVLAFAITHIAIYFIWWSKPLRVDRPIVLVQYTLPDISRMKSHRRNILVRFVKSLELSGRKVLGTTSVHPTDSDTDSRVPLLWAGKVEGRNLLGASGVAALMAVIFGGVHALAWNFNFHTNIERLLWRISCAVLVIGPTFIVILYSMLLLGLLPSNTFFEAIYRILLAACATGYIGARLLLLALPVVALRELPYDTFRTVEWVGLIPHI